VSKASKGKELPAPKISVKSANSTEKAATAGDLLDQPVSGSPNPVRLSERYVSNPVSWWADFLRASSADRPGDDSRRLATIDFFCSIGGLTLGAKVACEMLGIRMEVEGAADTDQDALEVFASNFRPRRVINESVRDLVDFQITEDDRSGRSRFRYATKAGMADSLRSPDLLVGGPPCQGHSSLNNRTRGADPKNQLLLTMPAVAVAMDIPSVVIENVPNVLNDSRRVVRIAQDLFQSHGYSVENVVIAANKLGWPQMRKRFFMIARREPRDFTVNDVLDAIRMEPQSLSWAIQDLLSMPMSDESLMDSVPKMSEENERRVRWLFDNDSYELADHERPKCHQDGHTYPSVYGRLHWDEPAPTITGGFMTPGRGRFVHPLRQRVLTPHEAARVQGLPDDFEFEPATGSALTRARLGKWIGDAVPPILGAVAVLAAIA
jgi:DNA (cytosine-5)-methyltransferase 1